MALSYKDWLKAKGIKTSTARTAQAYRNSGHYQGGGGGGGGGGGPAPPPDPAPAPLPPPEPPPNFTAPTLTAPPTFSRPAFNPSAGLDSLGTLQQGDLDFGKTTQIAAADRDKASAMAEIAAGRVEADRMQKLGLRDNTRAHAARNTLRSGINVHDEGEVRAARLRQEGGFNRQTSSVANQHQSASDAAELAWRTGSTGVKQGNWDRQQQKAADAHGNAVAQTQYANDTAQTQADADYTNAMNAWQHRQRR